MDKLKAFLAVAGQKLSGAWGIIKAALIGIAGLILALEFTKIKDALIVRSGKKELEKDEIKDEALSKDQIAKNAEADALFQKSKNENSDVDWYKKK